MTDRPLIFSARMVRALIAGRKTQTRRVLKPPPVSCLNWGDPPAGTYPSKNGWSRLPYAPGDRLWVREAWGYDWYDDGNTRAWKHVVYRADDNAVPMDNGSVTPWRPSIYMPRQASRLTLEVTNVRIQPLQTITEEDAEAEGCVIGPVSGNAWETAEDMRFGNDPSWPSARDWYADLWDSINGKGAWEKNPWVAALSFTVHHCNIDEMKKAHTV